MGLTIEDRIRLEWPFPADLNEEIGGRNWVVARRTQRIIERYGAGVICLSRKQFEAARVRAVARLKGHNG